MKRTILIFALALMICVVLAGCMQQPETETDETILDINPKAEAAGKDTTNVTLYFSYQGESLLAGETRTIDVPVSEPLETAVVRALIDGPSADRDELSPLFWQGVELVETRSTGNYIFVTLSEEFITIEPEEIDILSGVTEAEQKQLAIYSIVNTLIEMGTYSRVQIYVQRNGDEGGRILLEEAGFEGDADETLNELGRYSDIILTEENTLTQALLSFANKDWTRLYMFTANQDQSGNAKPDLSTFSEALAAEGNVLDSYQVIDSVVAQDGQSAVVMLDYSIKQRQGELVTNENIPVVLVREDDIWKLTYASLANILIDE